MHKPPTPWSCFLLAACLCAGHNAFAHDTWFAPQARTSAAERVLALGTGSQFPVLESAIDAVHLRRHGCSSGDTNTAAQPLIPLRDTDTALLLGTPAAAASCWIQLAPFEIVLQPSLVGVYLNEVRPPQAVLDAWAAISARGLPWKERYTKHARITLRGGAPAAAASTMDMDVLIDAAPAVLKTGQPLVFQLLRDGQPLPDFAVELRNERSRFGIWRRTDGEGRLRFAPPLAGQWLLRGIDLRLSSTEPDSWDSRFVTLAFEVQ